MKISVVIVSYNTKELLSDCLKSACISLQNIPSEVYVVDNDSKDETAEMVKTNFPHVKLIANTKNLGFSKANNQAINKVKGEYILILNPDTKLMPDTIEKMLKFMNKDDKIAVSTCRVELPNGQIDTDCRRHFPTPFRAFCHFSGFSKLFKGSKIFDQYYMGYIPDNIDHEVDSCVGAFMLVRKSAIEKVGLFDEDFFFYGEDLDWCWRFKEAGYKIIYTPRAKIIHYKGASSGMKKTSKDVTKVNPQVKKKALKESTRAMILFYKKHYMDKYPLFITWSVISAVKILEFIRLFSIY